MAYYIKDTDICKLTLSEEGKKLIISFINHKEQELPVYEGKQTSVGNGYNLLTKCYGLDYKLKNNYSCSLMVSPTEICVNPCMDINGHNYTKELYQYILDIKTELRDLKIKSIIYDRPI